MELMGHTDLKLTMKVYTDPRIFELSGAAVADPIGGSVGDGGGDRDGRKD